MCACQLVLVLLYRNAGIEIGFSVDGDILVENLKETSSIVQLQVYDEIICK